jgi:hypothetical protein
MAIKISISADRECNIFTPDSNTVLKNNFFLHFRETMKSLLIWAFAPVHLFSNTCIHKVSKKCYKVSKKCIHQDGCCEIAVATETGLLNLAPR